MQLPFPDLRSTVICVEVTIRSVFACLVDSEAKKACSTLKRTRDIYMHTACYIYTYSASCTYHSALAQVVLPAYFIAPVEIHTELKKGLLIHVHVTVC